jgi:hypothetical protein
MPLTLETAKTLLRNLVRTIDKKVDCSAVLHEGDRAGIAVTLSSKKVRTTLVITEEQLEAAEQDSMRRSQLRTLLKRSIDRMNFKPNEIASTKILRGAITDDGFFRPRQGGYRSGGR